MPPEARYCAGYRGSGQEKPRGQEETKCDNP
jgi:hypothetical protein